MSRRNKPVALASTFINAVVAHLDANPLDSGRFYPALTPNEDAVISATALKAFQEPVFGRPPSKKEAGEAMLSLAEQYAILGERVGLTETFKALIPAVQRTERNHQAAVTAKLPAFSRLLP